MVTTFKKLNISIGRSDRLETIKRLKDCVKVYHNKTLLFIIYPNSKVTACDFSSLIVSENSKVTAYNISTIEAWGNSIIIANENSKVTSYNNSSVHAYDNSTVVTYSSSRTFVHDNSIVNAYNNSIVNAYNKSTVNAYGESFINAYDISTINAQDNSIIIAYNYTRIIAHTFSLINIKSSRVKFTKTDNWCGVLLKQVFKVKKDIVVYKKLARRRICELLLKKGQTFQAEQRSKCRTNKALVLKIYNELDNTKTYKIGHSQFNKNFKYKVGEEVSSQYDKRIEECSTGIHFFLTKKEAEDF